MSALASLERFGEENLVFNNCWNLSLMKYFHVVSKKLTRNAGKVAIYIVRFFMDQTL